MDKFRYTKSEYIFARNQFLKDYKGDDWSEWSLKENQPVEEIILRALILMLEDVECICFAYVLEHTQLPEWAIKDLMFITSGAFDWYLYNDEGVDFVLSLDDKCERDEKYNAYADILDYMENGKNNQVKLWCEYINGVVHDKAVDTYASKFTRLAKITSELKFLQRRVANYERDVKLKTIPKGEKGVVEHQNKADKKQIQFLLELLPQEIEKVSNISISSLWDNLSYRVQDRFTWKRMYEYQDECPSFVRKKVEEDVRVK